MSLRPCRFASHSEAAGGSNLFLKNEIATPSLGLAMTGTEEQV
jgi:hypothetical protein